MLPIVISSGPGPQSKADTGTSQTVPSKGERFDDVFQSEKSAEQNVASTAHEPAAREKSNDNAESGVDADAKPETGQDVEVSLSVDALPSIDEFDDGPRDDLAIAENITPVRLTATKVKGQIADVVRVLPQKPTEPAAHSAKAPQAAAAATAPDTNIPDVVTGKLVGTTVANTVSVTLASLLDRLPTDATPVTLVKESSKALVQPATLALISQTVAAQSESAPNLTVTETAELPHIPKEAGSDRLPLTRMPEVTQAATPATPAQQPAVAMAQAQPIMVETVSQWSKSGSKPDLFADQTPLFSGQERLVSGTQTMTSTAAPTTAGAETARQVANQIAVAISGQPGRTTEISLNPEELGRVRLSMTVVDASITLNVLAERPETTDLLRRHIDALAQEFKDLGYDNLSFAFQDEKQANRGSQDDTDEPAAFVQNNEGALHQSPSIRPATASAGLDLRL